MKLTVDKLSFSYGGSDILHDISFTLNSGELMSILGPNGVGKSTLFRCILGSLPDYSGLVSIDGKDIRTLSRNQRAAAIAYIPQIHKPTFGYSVLDTVLMGVSRKMHTFAQPDADHIDCAMEAIRRVGAEQLAEKDFSKLSGGQQQLVLIARAIAQQSDIIIMDEPTSALDYGNQLRAFELIRSLADEGFGILLSTHNPQHALSYADSMLALSGGRIAAYGKPSELLDEKLMNLLYHVDVEFLDTHSGPVIIPKTGDTQ